MIRLARTIAALLGMTAIYWLYTLGAVPLIEPQVTNPGPKITDEQIKQAGGRLPEQLDRLRQYFPAGAPELDGPVVVESPDFMLLFKEYGSAADKQMHVKPCTLVYFPDGDANGTDPHRRVIVMRAPAGAVLDFEEGFDLQRAKLSKLLGGRLVGEVTIHGNLSGDGSPEGDLHIVTRDVQLTSARIWTPHEVKLRYGSNFGGGSDLRIELLNAPDEDPSKPSRITGVASISLARDVQLSIQTDKAGLLPGDEAPQRPSNAKPNEPLEVRCNGAFRFDVPARVATFEDRVDIIQPNPSGPSDQLSCELLAIYFSGSQPADAPPRQAAVNPKQQFGDIAPLRIVAQGAPVIVNSPLRRASARGEHLQYDFNTRQIQLDGSRGVKLTFQTHSIEAKNVQYTPGAQGELGRAVAAGPGRLLARLPDKPDELFEATWQQELRVRPHEGKQLISLLGGVRVGYGGLGRLTSDQIWLWFLETPAASAAADDDKPFGRVMPHSLLARGNVDIDSPRLIGLTEQLEVWFQSQPQGVPRPAATVGFPGGNPLAGDSRGEAETGRAPSQYHVGGKLIRVQVLTDGRDVQLQDVSMEGNVRLIESVTREDEQPLRVTGDQLQLLNADSPQATVAVIGKPADLSVRGLGLRGDEIRLSQGANRLWIDGAGTITLPIDRDLDGQRLAQPRQFQVDWLGRMNFDGQRLLVERGVVARGAQQSLRTETLEVQLSQTVQFSEPPRQNEVEISRVTCLGGVLLENRTLEEFRLVSTDKLQAQNLTLMPLANKLQADGPGWISSVRQGAPQGLSGSSLGGGAASAAGGNDQLTYLRITFEKGIEGNSALQELTFHDQIRGIYGPVSDWNSELPADDSYELRAEDIRLTCDRLHVRQVGTPQAGERPIELECDGNVRVSGQTFEGWARRLSYAVAKGQLVFEGTAQEDARLSRQKYIGGPTTNFAARKILYWHADQRVKVEDARFLQTGGM